LVWHSKHGVFVQKNQPLIFVKDIKRVSGIFKS
jgi:hypothetical protein